MSRVLILHSSVHGHAHKICDHLKQQLIDMGNVVTLANINDETEVANNLAQYDKVVIGASIRHGKHNESVFDYVARHKTALESKLSSFFSVSLVARKPNRNTPETNQYMQAFLEKSAWKPDLLQVFGGRLNYPHYGIMDRNIIRFIMWITKGPTAKDTDIDYTDWHKVDAFALAVDQQQVKV